MQNSAFAWLRARAENVLALMMAVMFTAFILQVIFRYLVNLPLAWTEEVCVFMWMWGILWGAGLVLSDREEIRFDIVYTHVSKRWQRWMTALSSGGWVIIALASVPASWAYIRFMGREQSAAMGIRMDLVFALYIVFLVAMVARHARLTWAAAANQLPQSAAPGASNPDSASN